MDENTIEGSQEHILTHEEEIQQLRLINLKLGLSLSLMSEFHLTFDDKNNIANSIDIAETEKDVRFVYDEYRKLILDKALSDDMADFQMSPDFKANLFSYFTVSLGYNPIDDMSGDVTIIKDYFDFENKIRSTPNAGQRIPMTEKLMEKRPGTTEALNRVIDSINSFYKKEK